MNTAQWAITVIWIGRTIWLFMDFVACWWRGMRFAYGGKPDDAMVWLNRSITVMEQAVILAVILFILRAIAA